MSQRHGEHARLQAIFLKHNINVLPTVAACRTRATTADDVSDDDDW